MTNAYIRGLTFLGCDGSRFESIDQLVVESSDFLGQNNSQTALSISESSVNISETTFLSNTGAASKGGALSVSNSSVGIDGCSFKGNMVKSGGAIYFEYESTITIHNSTFTSNRAQAAIVKVQLSVATIVVLYTSMEVVQ